MIQAFNIEPYPKKLWVAKNENWEMLHAFFCYDCDVSDITQNTLDNEASALTFPKVTDSKGAGGYLVFLSDCCKIQHVAHEAAHVAIHVYEDCFMQLKVGMDSEPFAYLLESIFCKIKEVLEKEEKNAATPFDLQDVAQGAKQLLAYGTASEEVNDTIKKMI